MSMQQFESDVIVTSAGELTLIFLGHGTLLLTFQEQNIHIDPFSRVADYSQLPKADIVLITHEHGDHLDVGALAQIRTPQTQIVLAPICAGQVTGGIFMSDGDQQTLNGIHIQAMPAYNIVHKRGNGQPFHPPGLGNGYILTFGDTRIYIAGDTENIPEMHNLSDITCAFLPMNLPYTMTPTMVAEATKVFRPAILYPYHYGNTDPQKLVELLKDEPDIEVRIRKLA